MDIFKIVRKEKAIDWSDGREEKKVRIVMLDDIKADESYEKISVEPWIEIVRETGCLEPAFKQKTNDTKLDPWKFSSYLSNQE